MARAWRIGAALLGAVVLALVLTQLFLPKIAASRIASHLRKYGTVHSVSPEEVGTVAPLVIERWADCSVF